MSPRAAWRLERLGFSEVYDYTGGKADWLAAGMPTERAGPAPSPRVGDALTREVPTCSPDEPVGDAARRALAEGRDLNVVVNDQRIIQGRLRVTAETVDLGGSVEDHMEPGPTTVRPSEDLEKTRNRMSKRHVSTLLVSTPEGELLGVLDDGT